VDRTCYAYAQYNSGLEVGKATAKQYVHKVNRAMLESFGIDIPGFPGMVKKRDDSARSADVVLLTLNNFMNFLPQGIWLSLSVTLCNTFLR
jgi:hypothetical protein